MSKQEQAGSEQPWQFEQLQAFFRKQGQPTKTPTQMAEYVTNLEAAFAVATNAHIADRIALEQRAEQAEAERDDWRRGYHMQDQEERNARNEWLDQLAAVQKALREKQREIHNALIAAGLTISSYGKHRGKAEDCPACREALA